MIRRNIPLGSDSPVSWLLVKQTVHAQLSYDLAIAWGSLAIGPLFCDPQDDKHPFYRVRQEFLEAVRIHDDGWINWGEDPEIDPVYGRPYGFTEMPTQAAQRIWSDSIDRCEQISPFAGWIVASHFSWLQSKQDEDFKEWEAWIKQVDTERKVMLNKWLDQSPEHTEQLAERSLSWLQAFDWMSLWLCCYARLFEEDKMPEPMVIGGDVLDGKTEWPEIRFLPNGFNEAGHPILRVDPWPFVVDELKLSVDAEVLPLGVYQEIKKEDVSPRPISWILTS